MNSTSSNRELVFETQRLYIRPAIPEDIELYIKLWTSPEVMHQVGFPKGLRVNRDELVDRLSSPMVLEFERLLVVVRKSDEKTVGECMMHLPDEAGVAEPDVKLLPEFWGKGYGSEAWKGLVAYLFDHTDCKVVQSTPNVNNLPSIKMMEKAGGLQVDEAVHEFPENMRDFTVPVHYYVYHVTRETWEALRDKNA
jgi:ribosomal-protein-alanine N-acetyltransferase